MERGDQAYFKDGKYLLNGKVIDESDMIEIAQFLDDKEESEIWTLSTKD